MDADRVLVPRQEYRDDAPAGLRVDVWRGGSAPPPDRLDDVALDVTDPEPVPPGHPLWTAPGVLFTPHVGGGSDTFAPRARRFVADQLRRWLAGEPLANEIRIGGES